MASSAAVCALDCGPHGRCLNGGCVCSVGYTGAGCNVRACSAACAAPRGDCVRGRCVCREGFVGKDCATDVCGKAAGLVCSARGKCVGQSEDGGLHGQKAYRSVAT